jgi:hypothetical protein
VPRDAEEIAHLYQSRVDRLGPLHARMVEVRDTYNGDVVIPLPEISKHEQATVANLTQRGLDAIAQRAASVLPDLHYPALRPSIKASVEKATTRRKVNYGWWERTGIRRVMQRRARWFLGYAQAPVIIRPDPKLQIPVWEPFSPLDTFPAPTRLDGIEPDDVIVRHKRTKRWIEERYPEAAGLVRKPKDCPPDAVFDVLEYIDDREIVFVVLGQADDDQFAATPEKVTMAVEMVRLDNRAGVCWAVVPGRISLDRPVGQFDAILGMYQTQAAITAMEIIALRKTIFPDTWLVNANTGAQPHIVQEPDYELGQPGIVVNGIIDRQQIPPNFAAGQIAARLEGAQRDTAGLPPELGGMSQSNVRTARRGSQVLGASIDFTIAEAQDTFTQSLHAENVRAIEIDKAYFNTSKSFYVSTKGQQGLVEYKPSETFEAKAEHIVSYPLAGTDLSDLVINGGQRVGMGTMSKRSFMKIDPLVDDVDAEEAQIKMEGVDAAFFAAFQEQMATPEAPWQMEQVADFAKRLAGGQVWYEAVAEINRELQEKQAEGAVPGSPEAMPGLAPPGAPGAGVPTVGEPSPSMGNLTQLLNQLGSADTAMAMR